MANVSFPSQSFLQEIEHTAAQLAYEAGRILLEKFGKSIRIEYKSSGKWNPVTEVDKESEAFLSKEIRLRYPSHGVLGEEGAGEGSDPTAFTWVLDPLDGTVNFLNGFPVFAVSVGVLWRGKPVVGAIFVPWVGEDVGLVFHASFGGGAWVKGVAQQLPWHVDASYSNLITGPAVMRRSLWLAREEPGQPFEFRGTGSIAYEMAMVAKGTLQTAFFSRPRIWDVAAGVVIVREAGGQILQSIKGEWCPFADFGSAGEFEWPGQETLRTWTLPLQADREGIPELTRPRRNRSLVRQWFENAKQKLISSKGSF